MPSSTSLSPGVLTDSHLINTQPATSSDSASRPKLAQKRSVKAISRNYEGATDGLTLSPPSRSPSPSPVDTYRAHNASLYPAASEVALGGRRSSLLLASGSYPSTLVATPPRRGSPSHVSSQGVPSRSPSIRLASGSYPSTLQPPSRKTSSSSLRPLPSPPTRVVTEEMVQDPSRDFDVVATSHDQVYQEDAGLLEALDDVTDLSPARSKYSSAEESPLDLSKLTLAERREHSRRHSRIHQRNLSAFFPQPGTEAEAEADQAKASEVYDQSRNHQAVNMPSAEPASNIHRRMGSGNRPQITVSTDTTTLSPRSAQAAAFQDSTAVVDPHYGHDADLSPSPSKSRRGHHHRHSVAMFDAAYSSSSPGHADTPMVKTASSASQYYDAPAAPHRDSVSSFVDPHAVHHHHHHHNTKRSLHSRTVSALGHIPQTSRPLMLFGISHFGLGAALWVAGQEADSLAATGLGYLVVFDAMGILGSAVADWASEWEQHASDLRRGRGSGNTEGISLRRPYGTHRVATLLQFVQTIYLLFASVYVLKESVEHALLQGTEDGVDMTGAASGHEHSHAHAEQMLGLQMPNLLLALSLAACLFSNIVMGNHARLVAACGISTAAGGPAGGVSARAGHGRSGSVLMRPSALASPLLALLANPFSLTVLFFSATLLFAGITMPPIQVAALDKVLAGLESVSMFYVAYPASAALGRVLLQTAPDGTSPAKQQLTRALRTVEEHPLVSYVAPPSLWQLTPPTSSHTEPGVLAGGGGGRAGGHGQGRGIHYGSKTASLIASVTVFLKADAVEQDCFEMTKWVWERLAPSIGAGRGLLAGEMLRGALRAGELIVSVKRENHHNDGTDIHFSIPHDHHHNHGHDHHGHDHHGHDHHGHDHHGHDHHGHGHDHHGHDHSHDHSHVSHSHSHCNHHH